MTVSERIQSDITENPVMLYMKGNAMFPQCGFSARVVQILTHMGVPFQTANVLEDAELRDGVKAVLQLADHSPALRQGRIRRRLRHRDRDVPVRRTRLLPHRKRRAARSHRLTSLTPSRGDQSRIAAWTKLLSPSIRAACASSSSLALLR